MSDINTFPRVKRLSETVAKQIAAGEVIERPASVVKELIENSIDAAANRLDIHIVQSGMSLIRVRDNGQGIHKDDMALVLQAHTTSKLSKFSDLSQIVSLGFRGEAIASIASVSRFKMISRLAGTDQGWSIDNQGDLKPAALDGGTTVEVADLFFSTPARRKFLKSDRTEFLHIQALIRAVALSHFQVAFNVKHNEQSLFRLSACVDDFERRVADVCGHSFLNKSIRLDIEHEGMRLWGWLGLDDVSRSQTDRQYFYVNGRIVRDKHVNHAIRLAYDERIATGRFPCYVLHLQIDPGQLDVNVHPAKAEVRFSETRNVHDFIYSSLLDAINRPVTNSVNHHAEKYTVSDQEPLIDRPMDIVDTTQFKQAHIVKQSIADIAYLSLLKGRYIIVSWSALSFLIDVPLARKVITAHSLYSDFSSNNITQRPILVPVAVELSPEQIEFLIKEKALINQWGFELQQVGPSQIAIRALPARLQYAAAVELVKSFLAAVMRTESDLSVANQMAEHVNDAGMDLNYEDVSRLVKEISVYEQGSPHSKTRPWRELDDETLMTLLAR